MKNKKLISFITLLIMVNSLFTNFSLVHATEEDYITVTVPMTFSRFKAPDGSYRDNSSNGYNYLGSGWAIAEGFDLNDYSILKDAEKIEMVRYVYNCSKAESRPPWAFNKAITDKNYLSLTDAQLFDLTGYTANWYPLFEANTTELSVAESVTPEITDVTAEVKNALDTTGFLTVIYTNNDGTEAKLPISGSKYAATITAVLPKVDVLGLINEAADGKALKDVITKYGFLIDINADDIEEEVYTALTADDYATVEEFKSAFAEKSRLILYVSTTGNDRASGSLDSPLATLAGARDKIRIYKSVKGYPEKGITVVFRGGSYFFENEVNFCKEDSGTEEAPIEYRAYPGEEVVFEGGVKIPGSEFEKDYIGETLVYKINLKKFLEGKGIKNTHYANANADADYYDFFGRASNSSSHAQSVFAFDDAPALWVSSYPNRSGGFYPEECPDMQFVKMTDVLDKTNQKTVFSYSDSTIAKYVGKNDAYAYIIPSFRHEWTRVNILSDSVIETMHSTSGEKNCKFFLYNIKEELDAPGEYYIDKETQDFYVYPNVENINTTNLNVPVFSGEYMVALRDTSNVTFSGITFENCKNNAFLSDGGSNVKLYQCSIKNAGFHAVDIGKSNGRSEIWGGHPDTPGISHGCNYIGATGSPEDYPDKSYDYWMGSNGDCYGSNSGLDSCFIMNTGAESVSLTGGNCWRNEKCNHYVVKSKIIHSSQFVTTYAGSIRCSGNGFIIKNNELAHTQNTLFGGWGTISDLIFDRNELYDCMKSSTDNGMIYINYLNPNLGLEFTNNYWHDVPAELPQNTVYSGGSERSAIYLDNGSFGAGIKICGNIFANIPMAFINTKLNSLYSDNLFVDCFCSLPADKLWSEPWINISDFTNRTAHLDGGYEYLNLVYLPLYSNNHMTANKFRSFLSEKYPEFLEMLDVFAQNKNPEGLFYSKIVDNLCINSAVPKSNLNADYNNYNMYTGDVTYSEGRNNRFISDTSVLYDYNAKNYSLKKEARSRYGCNPVDLAEVGTGLKWVGSEAYQKGFNPIPDGNEGTMVYSSIITIPTESTMLELNDEYTNSQLYNVFSWKTKIAYAFDLSKLKNKKISRAYFDYYTFNYADNPTSEQKYIAYIYTKGAVMPENVQDLPEYFDLSGLNGILADGTNANNITFYGDNGIEPSRNSIDLTKQITDLVSVGDFSVILNNNNGSNWKLPVAGRAYCASLRVYISEDYGEQALEAVESADTVDEMRKALADYQDIFDINLSENDNDFVIKSLMGRKFASVDEVKKCYNDASLNTYSYIEITADTSIYRLDFNNNITFSNTYPFNKLIYGMKLAYIFDLSNYRNILANAEDVTLKIYPYNRDENTNGNYAIEMFTTDNEFVQDVELEEFFSTTEYINSRWYSPRTDNIEFSEPIYDSFDITDDVNKTLNTTSRLNVILKNNNGTNWEFPSVGERFAPTISVKLNNSNLLYMINHAKNVAEFKGVLSSSTAFAGVDTDVLSDTGYGYLIEKNYKSIDEVKVAFSDKVFEESGRYPLFLKSNNLIEKKVYANDTLMFEKNKISNVSNYLPLQDSNSNALISFDTDSFSDAIKEYDLIKSAKLVFYPYNHNGYDDLYATLHTNNQEFPTAIEDNSSIEKTSQWDSVWNSGYSYGSNLINIISDNKSDFLVNHFSPIPQQYFILDAVKNALNKQKINICLSGHDGNEYKIAAKGTANSPYLSVRLPDYDIMLAVNNMSAAQELKYLIKNYYTYFNINLSNIDDDKINVVVKAIYNEKFLSEQAFTEKVNDAMEEYENLKYIFNHNQTIDDFYQRIQGKSKYFSSDEFDKIVGKFDDLEESEKNEILTKLTSYASFNSLDEAFESFADIVNNYSSKGNVYEIRGTTVKTDNENVIIEGVSIKKIKNYYGNSVFIFCKYFDDKLVSVKIPESSTKILQENEKGDTFTIYDDFTLNNAMESAKFLIWEEASLKPLAEVKLADKRNIAYSEYNADSDTDLSLDDETVLLKASASAAAYEGEYTDSTYNLIQDRSQVSYTFDLSDYISQAERIKSVNFIMYPYNYQNYSRDEYKYVTSIICKNENMPNITDIDAMDKFFSTDDLYLKGDFFWADFLNDNTGDFIGFPNSNINGKLFDLSVPFRKALRNGGYLSVILRSNNGTKWKLPSANSNYSAVLEIVME